MNETTGIGASGWPIDAYPDGEWIDEGELFEEGDGAWIVDDAPVLPAAVAANQAALLTRLCGELRRLRREWKLANSRAYQVYLEERAASCLAYLEWAVDEALASEGEYVAD